MFRVSSSFTGWRVQHRQHVSYPLRWMCDETLHGERVPVSRYLVPISSSMLLQNSTSGIPQRMLSRNAESSSDPHDRPLHRNQKSTATVTHEDVLGSIQMSLSR